MEQSNVEITPSLTVHALLEAYPELEEVLIGLAPPFKKLKNPFLRRSVAKVATMKHIASVGGIPLDSFAVVFLSLVQIVGNNSISIGHPTKKLGVEFLLTTKRKHTLAHHHEIGPILVCRVDGQQLFLQTRISRR